MLTEAVLMKHLLAILCVVIFSFGVGASLQKHGMFTSFSRRGEKNIFSFLHGFLNPVWVAGFCIGMVGWLLYFQAVALMDISFVQPMINFSVIIAIFISLVLLHEKLSHRESAGVLFILFGGFFLLKGGATSETADVVHFSKLSWFLLAALLVSFLLVLVLWKVKTLVLKEVMTSLLSGSLKGIAAVLVKATTFLVERQTHDYNVFSLATWKDQLSNYPFWVMIVANAAGYLLMQYAFSFGRASVVVPVESMASFLLPVLAGAFVFSEEISIMRAAGLLVIASGVLVLLRSTDEKRSKTFELPLERR